MAAPTITINGKDISMKTKARLWRVIAEFNERRKNIPMSDFVEEHCKIISAAYGLPLDEVLDNMEIGDVIPACHQVINYAGEQLTAKSLKKKQDEEPV